MGGAWYGFRVRWDESVEGVSVVEEEQVGFHKSNE